MDEIDRRKPLVGGGQNDEQKPEKKPSKVGMVLGILFLLALVLIVGYFGVITLVRKSDVRAQTEGDKYKYQNGEWTSFQAYYSLTWGETTTYRHTISMIPTAYEHYFLVADKDLINYVLVRADKNWYEKNFGEGVAIDPEGVTVTGYVRRTDSEVANDVSDRVKTLTAEIRHNHPGFWGFNGTTASFVDTIATRVAIYEIIMCVVPILMGILFFVYRKTLATTQLNSKTGKCIGTAGLIGFVVYALFAIHALSLM